MLIPEDDRLPAVNENPVGEMPADTAGKGEPFAVAAESQEIRCAVKMLHPGDLLIDNRSLVEIRGDVVTGCTDKLHAAFEGSLVRICPDERREEGVVNIHHLARPSRAELWRNNLHIARKHHKIRPCLPPQHLNLLKGGLLRIGRYRNVVERDPLTLHHLTEVFVIGDHTGDIERQLPRTPAPQQICEAVAKLAGHQHHTHPALCRANAPLGDQLVCERLKLAPELNEIAAQGMGINRQPREEPARMSIGKLMHFLEVASVLGDKAGDAGQEADTVGTGELQEGRGHGGSGESTQFSVLSNQ